MKKFVKESLLEFTRSEDAYTEMGMGAKIKIQDWIKEMGIADFNINEDMTIDVHGDVRLNNKELTTFPNFVTFGKVSGAFYCYENKLTSLRGCPHTVGEDFYCNDNQLTSLEGGPKKVGQFYNCSNNKLTSLDGCAETVAGGFYCHGNELYSLEGCPEKLRGDFWCSDNKLLSLTGCPKSVHGDFVCKGNAKEFTRREVAFNCPDLTGTIHNFDQKPSFRHDTPTI